MHKFLLALAVLAPSLIASAPAAAQSTPIEAPADKPFLIANSGITLPVAIAGMNRSKLAQYGEGQLDIIANYELPGQNEVISVYVYRLVAGSAPVWFDRARAQIEGRRDVYGTVSRLPGPAAFALPGQSVATGLTATYSVEGPFRSSSVAIVPMGQWLVKIRYSSASLDAPALAAKVQSALTALTWPATIPAAPAAAEIADCAEPLKFKGEAKLARQSGEDAMMAALLGGALSVAVDNDESIAKEDKGPPPVWCRDPDPQWKGTVYRPDNAMNSYLLALGDSGRALNVSPDLSGLVTGKGKNQVSIQWVELHRTRIYPPVDRLPTPTRAIEIVNGTAPGSTVTTWGDKRDIQLNMGGKD